MRHRPGYGGAAQEPGWCLVPRCLRYGIPLVALNSADFGDFAEHRGLVLLGEREGGRRR
jgi:hypothetical protein